MLPPCQFSPRKSLGTCDALLTFFHRLQVALDSGIEGRLVQLDFSDRVSHCGILNKLRSIVGAGQFLSIVSKFLTQSRMIGGYVRITGGNGGRMFIL